MSDNCAILQRYLEKAIPQVVSMQVSVDDACDERVALSAPLAPNINHQSTAFGGSVASLATLACWGWLWNHLRAPGADTVHAQLVVARAEIDYLKPIASAMTASCTAPNAETLKAFEGTYARRGRARIVLEAVVEDADGIACARFLGRFVASSSRP